MSRGIRLTLVGAVLLVVLLTLFLRHGAERDAQDRSAAKSTASESAPASVAAPPAAMPIAPAAPAPEPAPASIAPAPKPASTPATLPRLVDVGAGTCIPCKMMAPILDELGREYAGVFKVDVYDLRQDRAAATQYSVRVIPTQVFFDAAGRELFRHEGFFAKEDILAKWRELGVKLPAPSATASRG
jgi:thioredoxin 1